MAAQGSPFWLHALVRVGSATTRPQQLLTVLLRGASSDAVSLLELLAAAGRPLSVSDAVALSDWPVGRVEVAADELARRGVAVELANSVRLTHDLIREAASGGLPEGRRREMHRRLALRLEQEAGDDLELLREALEHRRAAGLPAILLATRIARSPKRRLLGPEGLRLLAGIADDADPFDEDALALHEDVASLASELAEHDEALKRWSLVSEHATTPAHRANALLAASKAAFGRTQAAEARELLRESRDVGAEDDVLDLEQRTHDAALRLWLERRTDEGRVLARDAIAVAERLERRAGGIEELDDRARRAYLDAMRIGCDAALQDADAETLLLIATRSVAAARGFDLESYLRASLNVGTALRFDARVREARVRFQSVWEQAHRHVLPHLAIDAGFWLASQLANLGELREAERVVEDSVQLASRAGDIPRARHRIAWLACFIGMERGPAGEMLRRLERETAAETNEHQRIRFYEELALWYARLAVENAGTRARAALSLADECSRAVGCSRCGAELALSSVEVLARLGDRVAALAAFGGWEALGRPSMAPGAAVRALHTRALCTSDASARVTELREAESAADAADEVTAGLWIALDLGIALADSGSRDEDINTLQHLVTRADERGAATLQELVERSLRSLGIRTWKRTRAGSPLTKRELEVAALVAGGGTNREIAEMLFLSPKTVERHVSNALRKLDARNRTELASRVRESTARDGGNAR